MIIWKAESKPLYGTITFFSNLVVALTWSQFELECFSLSEH